jgi:energy-coupling factor transporter ATP-binding protein EcfA2
MMELPRGPCWDAAAISEVISNEALEDREGVFLATHTPIAGFTVSGSHAGEIEGHDEEAVLKALSAPSRRHAFCVVQGEPGSGKSHLIRWLSVNWPRGTDVKLLLQRADGSLEGALRQLRERLPSEFHDLFDRLGRRHRAGEQGREKMLLSNLATMLDPGHFDPPLEDDGWCRENLPGELVGHRDVKEEWKGPARILRLMQGSGSRGDEARNSQSASFDLFDIEELAGCCRRIHGSGVRPATERLAHKLVNEAGSIAELRANDWTAEEIEREEADRLPFSMRLMQALNRRRNDAVQNLLGVSADGLKTLFREVREELGKRGARLVLLLEDITSWEGIDDSLIDALVTNADTRGADGDHDMCPLISVVGVTPAYYQKLHGNYRGRITHELSLGDASGEGELQDVVTLRHRDSRLSFVARYLAAVRVGSTALDRWRERRREEPGLAPPNRCDQCGVRDGCHLTFGAMGGTGLFPFTAHALDRFFDALNDRDGGMTWRTPRGVLQAILSPVLGQAPALADGRFPTALLESRGLVAESRSLSPLLERSLDAAIEDDAERGRMRRVLAYWGDRERADTTELDNGGLAFAEVPEGIFSAFRLPWIGGKAAEPSRPAPPRPPSEPAPAEPPPAVRPAPAVAPSADQRLPPSKRKAPTRSELERLRAQLRNWADEGNLESPSEWNRRAHALVQEIDPRRIGLDPYTFKRLVTQEQVKIEGTAPVQRGYLVIPKEKWVQEGLEADIALRLDKDVSMRTLEFHRGALAVMMRHLERLAGDYADLRLSFLQDGSRWSPVPAFVQVLLARAWLRGTAFADDPPHKQLRAVLSDETDAESDPAARCQPWREYLASTKDWHERLREGLREMLGTPQGGAPGFGLADVSLAAGAVRRLRATLRFDSVPNETVETHVREFDKVCEIIAGVNGGIARLAGIEARQIQERAEALRTNLRGLSIRGHLARVDEAVEAVSKHLPNADPVKVKEWKMDHHRIGQRLEAEADRRVEDLLLSLSPDGDGMPDGQAAGFGWLARAPARDLEVFRDLSQKGEQVVAELLEHVRDCVKAGAGSASLDQIHAIGGAFRAVIRGAETVSE